MPHLPAAEEIVLFNRSWYNRAGVERVMGFCTDAEYEEFMETVVEFEHMLVRSGIRLFKYYLDISKAEQKKRLEDRRNDPLKQWKVSPIDDRGAEALGATTASPATRCSPAPTRPWRRGRWSAPTTSASPAST